MSLDQNEDFNSTTVDSYFSLGTQLKMLIEILIAGLAACAVSSPLPSHKQLDANKILYDQRQEGEWNVRADLKNFIILIIPTPTSTPASSPSLLDFLTKSLPARVRTKGPKPHKNQNPDPAQETMHFIESKTAPYHVDITKTKEELAKLHPNADEVLVANSPSIAIIKSDAEEGSTVSIDHHGRAARAFVLTAPVGEDIVISKTEDSREVVKKDGKKFKVHSLKLLGAENEQCGPGMARDSYGICRTYEHL